MKNGYYPKNKNINLSKDEKKIFIFWNKIKNKKPKNYDDAICHKMKKF